MQLPSCLHSLEMFLLRSSNNGYWHDLVALIMLLTLLFSWEIRLKRTDIAKTSV